MRAVIRKSIIGNQLLWFVLCLGVNSSFAPAVSALETSSAHRCSKLPTGWWLCNTRLRNGSTQISMGATCESARLDAIRFCSNKDICVTPIQHACPQSEVKSSLQATMPSQAPVANLSALQQSVASVAVEACLNPIQRASELASLRVELMTVLGVSEVEKIADQWNQLIAQSTEDGSSTLSMSGEAGSAPEFLADAQRLFVSAGKNFQIQGEMVKAQEDRENARDSVIFIARGENAFLLTGRKFLVTPTVAGSAPEALQEITVFRERNFRTGQEKLKVSYQRSGVAKTATLDELASDWLSARCSTLIQQMDRGWQESRFEWNEGVPSAFISSEKAAKDGWVVIDEKAIPSHLTPDEKMAYRKFLYKKALMNASPAN